ncbi:hypothetical protein KC939_00805 [Candidatus Saccharibacteria bacterium]|nr:hypothetical protein [Candidatus Saccharibacteria bacterium]
MHKIIKINTKIFLFSIVTLSIFTTLLGGLQVNVSADPSLEQQYKNTCRRNAESIKKADVASANTKKLKQVYKKYCQASKKATKKAVSALASNEKALDRAIKKAKNSAKKKYKAECKTAAAKKTPKCEKLATAAGVASSPGTGGSAGSTIKKCGGVATAFNYGCDGADSESGGNDNPIFQVLFFIVNIVALGVGMVAVGGVIYGAILYTSAGDNGEQTKKGIHIIVNAVLGVTLFAFMYAILNFLVPGGLFT